MRRSATALVASPASRVDAQGANERSSTQSKSRSARCEKVTAERPSSWSAPTAALRGSSTARVMSRARYGTGCADGPISRSSPRYTKSAPGRCSSDRTSAALTVASCTVPTGASASGRGAAGSAVQSSAACVTDPKRLGTAMSPLSTMTTRVRSLASNRPMSPSSLRRSTS